MPNMPESKKIKGLFQNLIYFSVMQQECKVYVACYFNFLQAFVVLSPTMQSIVSSKFIPQTLHFNFAPTEKINI